MSMKDGKNKYFTREVILWVISFLPLLVFCIICYILIWLPDQNKRTFVEDISVNIEEAELYFRETEGWKIGIKKEEEKLFLIVTTEEGIQYIFRERYSGDNIDIIAQEVIREEDWQTIRGELQIISWGRDIAAVKIILERESVRVKYEIPEFELIDDWGDPAEAELKILRWVNKDKIRADWEYAEEIMQKLEEFVQLSPYDM